MKIGEMLLREGQLTGQQLARALRVQGLLGSRLGTTLLEEGLVAEATLLETLGRQHAIRTASRFDLAEVPPEVVRMIPARLAERYGVVPFRLEGRSLSVASKDAGDLLKEDEIGFLTSCTVKTCISLEIRIHEALERYYRIKSPDRLRALVRRFALRPNGRRPATAAGEPGANAPPARRETPETHADTKPALRVAVTPTASEPRKSPTPRAQPRFIELDEEDAALLGTSSSDAGAWAPSDEPVLLEPAPLPWLVRDAAAGGHGREKPTAMPPPKAEAKSEPPLQRTPESEKAGDLPADEADLEERLRRAAARLREVEIRDDIADVLLAFCRPYFRRRITLVARKDHIVGWRGEGQGVEPDKVRAIEIPAHDPSVFLGLTGAGSFWLGALPALDANKALVEGLGGTFPRECVVLPITLRSRVVCYLYGDNVEDGVGGGPVAELRRLAAKAGLAFEVYILKNKLRML